MQRDGPRKRENKEKEKNKTFQSSVENGGTDSSDQFFSDILF